MEWPRHLEELIIVKVATGHLTHWHHSDFRAPVACKGWELQWSPTSSWLALSINISRCQEKHFDEDWAIEYHGLDDECPEVLTLSSQEDRLHFVVSAADGQILHIWQPIDYGAMVACKAGLFDPCMQQMLYIGTIEALADIEDDVADALPILLPVDSALQAMLGPVLPCSAAAHLSPGGDLLLDFLDNTSYEPDEAEDPGEAESLPANALIHLSLKLPDPGQAHIIQTGCMGVLRGYFIPVWLSDIPGRLIYAFASQDSSVCIVDANYHTVLRSWRAAGPELSLSPRLDWRGMQVQDEAKLGTRLTQQLRWVDGAQALALSSILHTQNWSRWVAKVVVHTFDHT